MPIIELPVNLFPLENAIINNGEIIDVLDERRSLSWQLIHKWRRMFGKTPAATCFLPPLNLSERIKRQSKQQFKNLSTAIKQLSAPCEFVLKKPMCARHSALATRPGTIYSQTRQSQKNWKHIKH